MATLHVRNVPDTLYEALRASAEHNGRSIGAQAIALLNESLSTNRRGFPFFGPRLRGQQVEPFQRFTTEARAVVVEAQRVAGELEQDHVGTEHLLAALVGVALPEVVTAEAVRARLERGVGAPEGTIPFTPKAKQALELALRESLRERTPGIQARQLAVGVALADGRGAAILVELGIGVDALRLAPVLEFRMPEAEFRVVELEDDWEAQLNELADEYELVQIVERRAIFRRR
jgi:plasmid stability protein